MGRHNRMRGVALPLVGAGLSPGEHVLSALVFA